MITHVQSIGVSTDGRDNLSGGQTEVGSSESKTVQTFPAGYTDLALAFSRNALQSMILLATQNMVLQVNGTDEIQSLAITGTPTGGTFTLTYSGQTTAAIAYNAAASAVQAALVSLSNVGASGMACTGGPLPGTPVVCTFGGPLGRTNVAQMTTTDSLTGGSTPASAVTTTTAGVAPDETISLLAGSPMMWSRSQGYFANPFSNDVTAVRVNTITANRLNIKLLIA